MSSTEPKDKKTQIKLEELVLRIFMSNDNKAFSEEDIVSYELRGKKKRVSYILKELFRGDYISESMNGQLKKYTFNPKSMRIVYKDGTPKSIDLIATLDNYKNTLKKLYMKKVGYNLSLNELNDISGLDLTHGGKNILDGFQQQIDLKEELSKKITDDNSEDVFYWIVYRWGRITENGNSSVACFVEDYKKAKGKKEELLEQFSKQGRVASWSKILSFLYPHDYFIYDARVAFTLDYLLGETKFPVPSGSNTVINAHVDGSRQPTLDEYKEYCSLIKNIHSELWPEGDEKDKPYLTEMLIFSLLEDIGFCASIPEEFKLMFKNT